MLVSGPPRAGLAGWPGGGGGGGGGLLQGPFVFYSLAFEVNSFHMLAR